MAGVASQAGDADSSRAPGLTSGLQGVRECPPWYSIAGATVTVHQFFCILNYEEDYEHCRFLNTLSDFHDVIVENSPNLLIFGTFHLEYPTVKYRFYLFDCSVYIKYDLESETKM